jgi:hypothetical protein
MGNTFKTGNYVNAIFQDASNNIGIGAAPSGTYKLEVTGTAKVSTSAYFAIASGSVGIGTITPTSYFYTGNGLAIYNATQNTLSIATDTSGTSSLYFSNGASGAARYNGYLEYIHSTNSMTLGTGGFTRLTLGSTGNALFTGQIKTSFAGQSIAIDGGSTASVRMQLQNTSGNLAENAFYVGTSARDLDDRIIYDKKSGKLLYDADGNKAGGVAAVQIALIGSGSMKDLQNTDFIVI